MTENEMSNWAKGELFQNRVKKAIEKHFGISFNQNVKIDIGKPKKAHKYSLVSIDETIVVECKAYTWTTSGNVPSAKLTTVDQAVWYFSFLEDRKCIVVMEKVMRPKHNETLGEYYVRSHGHLLGEVEVFEFDEDNQLYPIK